MKRTLLAKIVLSLFGCIVVFICFNEVQWRRFMTWVTSSGLGGKGVRRALRLISQNFENMLMRFFFFYSSEFTTKPVSLIIYPHNLWAESWSRAKFAFFFSLSLSLSLFFCDLWTSAQVRAKKCLQKFGGDERWEGRSLVRDVFRGIIWAVFSSYMSAL